MKIHVLFEADIMQQVFSYKGLSGYGTGRDSAIGEDHGGQVSLWQDCKHLQTLALWKGDHRFPNRAVVLQLI